MTQQPQLNQKWTSFCEEDEIAEVEKRLLENYDLFLILERIILQKLKANSVIRRKQSAYDKPAYSEFQADCNGYERALEEVRTYLNIKKEE